MAAMASTKPYIGCRIGLISKAQNRYEGILYTIDRVNSMVVLAKVRCFGTEGRQCDVPTPPRDDIYEYITFRGSDIKDIALCDPPRAHGLPQDPAIVQSSSGGPYSPLRINQLAASSLLNQQYAAALGFGLNVRRGPMVEKAVQTLRMDRSWLRRSMAATQEQPCERTTTGQRQRQSPLSRRYTTAMGKTNVSGANVWQTAVQPESDRNNGNGSLRRRQGPRRRRNRSRGQLLVASVPSATLKFDTDFDFDSSNAQFLKEELEREMQDRLNIQDEMHDMAEKEQEESRANAEDDPFGPKCYYNKAKCFFDNISSDNKIRLTWAEERKRNLETFGVPGRFLRSQGFRGGPAGWRVRPTART